MSVHKLFRERNPVGFAVVLSTHLSFLFCSLSQSNHVSTAGLVRSPRDCIPLQPGARLQATPGCTRARRETVVDVVAFPAASKSTEVEIFLGYLLWGSQRRTRVRGTSSWRLSCPMELPRRHRHRGSTNYFAARTFCNWHAKRCKFLFPSFRSRHSPGLNSRYPRLHLYRSRLYSPVPAI